MNDDLDLIAEDADSNGQRAMIWAINENTRAVKALAEQQRIANLIALEKLRAERTRERGNYFGPDLLWTYPEKVTASAPLFDDIAEALGVPRG